MRGVLMGFGAMPARAAHSLMSPRRIARLHEMHSFLSASKSGVHAQNWTRMFSLKEHPVVNNPWLLPFQHPRYQVSTHQQSPSRQFRPRGLQAAKKTPARSISKGRKLQEFKTLHSSDLKYIEWWRVKVHLLLNCE